MANHKNPNRIFEDRTKLKTVSTDIKLMEQGESKMSDAQIVWKIVLEYIWGVPEIRKIIVPSFALVVLANILFIMQSRYLRIISQTVASERYDMRPVLLFGMTLFIYTVINELSSMFLAKTGHIGFRIANKRTYSYFLLLTPEDFRATPKGEMQNIIQRKAEAIRDILDVMTKQIMPLVVQLTICCTNIITVIGMVAAFILLVSVVIYCVITVRITEWRNKLRVKVNYNLDTSQNQLNDGLGNYETIFTTGTEEYEARKYERCLAKTQNNEIILTRSMYLLNAAQGSVWAIQLFSLLLVLCIIMKSLKAEDLSYMLPIINMFQKSLFNFGFMYGKFKTGAINIRKTDLPSRLKKTTGHKNLFAMKEQLSVYDLTYGYKNRLVLDQASFHVMKGDKVAIVGRNGSGKSTLLKSLTKFNSSEAQIFIDQVNCEDLADENYRSLVSYVPQSASLFNESVMYNIKYGNINVYDEQVYKAAMILGVHDSIKKLEFGYNTMCGENGSALSGGERQKIAILRAFLKNSSILLLDEPTASIDKEAEESIMRTLLSTPDTTVLAIVHNIDLLPLFNKVLLVEDKKVHEMTPLEFRQNVGFNSSVNARID